jgi:uncharacterized protein (DUF2237 family)
VSLQPRIAGDGDTQWDRINAEISRLGPDHPWAGIYRGGLTTFAMAPESGYTFSREGCCGRYDFDHGDVVATGEGLAFTSRLDPTLPRPLSTAGRFFAVRWGDRRYLIHSRSMEVFCDQFNSGWNPELDGRNGMFLLRSGDEKKPAPGLPDVPNRYRRLLRAQPLLARVVAVRGTSVNRWGRRELCVTLDVGERDSVRPGLELRLVRPGRWCLLTVRATEAASCDATIDYIDARRCGLAIGDVFTSRIRPL